MGGGGPQTPPPNQTELVGTAQGLGLRQPRGGQACAPHTEMTDMPHEDLEVPAGQARVGSRAPGRVHSRASMEET